MQTTLCLFRTSPATGAVVFTRVHATGTRKAAYARVPLVVQRIVRDLVFKKVGPDVFFGPSDQRIHFAETELRVPLNRHCGRAGLGLVASNGGDPSIEFAELSDERAHLTHLAATLRFSGP